MESGRWVVDVNETERRRGSWESWEREGEKGWVERRQAKPNWAATKLATRFSGCMDYGFVFAWVGVWGKYVSSQRFRISKCSLLSLLLLRVFYVHFQCFCWLRIACAWSTVVYRHRHGRITYRRVLPWIQGIIPVLLPPSSQFASFACSVQSKNSVLVCTDILVVTSTSTCTFNVPLLFSSVWESWFSYYYKYMAVQGERIINNHECSFLQKPRELSELDQ